MSVDSRLYGPGVVVSLIYLHEIVQTVLSGRLFIMTANFPDPPKSVESFMLLCFLKKYDNYLPDSNDKKQRSERPRGLDNFME